MAVGVPAGAANEALAGGMALRVVSSPGSEPPLELCDDGPLPPLPVGDGPFSRGSVAATAFVDALVLLPDPPFVLVLVLPVAGFYCTDK